MAYSYQDRVKWMCIVKCINIPRIVHRGDDYESVLG